MEETNAVKPPMTEIEYLRKLASEVPDAELQREMLAQLYLQNNRLKAIKGHLTFYTILFIASFLLAIAMFAQ